MDDVQDNAIQASENENLVNSYLNFLRNHDVLINEARSILEEIKVIESQAETATNESSFLAREAEKILHHHIKTIGENKSEKSKNLKIKVDLISTHALEAVESVKLIKELVIKAKNIVETKSWLKV